MARGAYSGADPGGVLGEGHVSHVVRGFHGPVALDKRGQAGGVGLAGGEAGDGVGRLRLDLAGLGVDAAPFDLDGLDGVREQQSGFDGAHLQPPYLAPSVPGGAGAVQQWHPAPGQAAQLLLVARNGALGR